MKCPLDNFELVLFSLGNTAGQLGKSYPLCPYCYSHPPEFAAEEKDGNGIGEKKDRVGGGVGEGGGVESGKARAISSDSHAEKTNMGAGNRGMGCNSCMHPSCKHSGRTLGVLSCPSVKTSEEGVTSVTGREGQVEVCSGSLVRAYVDLIELWAISLCV